MNKWRNRFITIFVILWCLAFHYESVRHFYLESFFNRSLPKIKFLFPPAGWIMFYHVDGAYGHRRIFGVKDGQDFEIDPHEIFRVRTIGFDNIHRGVISSAASERNSRTFCRYLYKQFSDFDDFIVLFTYYPDIVKEPYLNYHKALYNCKEYKGI